MQLGQDGIEQPSQRAKAVYDLAFQRVLDPQNGFSDVDRAAILARIATRSFGPYRRLSGSQCDCRRDSYANTCFEDRRVEIVVQGRLGGGKPNWAALQSFQWARPRAASNAP
jgi:hypothetical protein